MPRDEASSRSRSPPAAARDEIGDHFAAVFATPSSFRQEEAAAAEGTKKDGKERQGTNLSQGSNNAGSGEQEGKKGKETKAIANKELTKLTASIAELSLINAREISNLSACCYQTFLLEPESSLAKSALEGGQLYNDAVKKVKEKDDEEKKTLQQGLGSPKNAVFAMTLKGLAQEKGVTPKNKEALQKYWAERFANKENFEACDSDVKFCRATKAKKGVQKVKLQFALADEVLEKLFAVAILETKAAIKKQGQAPRGPLERTIQKAIEKMK